MTHSLMRHFRGTLNLMCSMCTDLRECLVLLDKQKEKNMHYINLSCSTSVAAAALYVCIALKSEVMVQDQPNLKKSASDAKQRKKHCEMNCYIFTHGNHFPHFSLKCYYTPWPWALTERRCSYPQLFSSLILCVKFLCPVVVTCLFFIYLFF